MSNNSYQFNLNPTIKTQNNINLNTKSQINPFQISRIPPINRNTTSNFQNQYPIPKIVNQTYQKIQIGTNLIPSNHSVLRQHPTINSNKFPNGSAQKYVPPQQITEVYRPAQRQTRPPQKWENVQTQEPIHEPLNVSCSPCSPCLAGCCICCPTTCQNCCRPTGSCSCCTKCCLPGQSCSCWRSCCQHAGPCGCCQTCCLPKGMCSCCTKCCLSGQSCQCCITCTKKNGACQCCENCCKPGCEGLDCCPNSCKQCCKSCCCPWWVIALIILLLLAALLIGLILGTKKGNQIYNLKTNTPAENKKAPTPLAANTNNPNNDLCEAGFFIYSGQCIKCPQGSFWNGQNCIQPQKHI